MVTLADFKFLEASEDSGNDGWFRNDSSAVAHELGGPLSRELVDATPDTTQPEGRLGHAVGLRVLAQRRGCELTALKVISPRISME